MNRKTILLLTVLLITIFSLGAGIRANGRANRIPDITAEGYRSIERKYVEEVRETLDKNGFANAGISMTKQVNETGGFDYTLNVHHRRIDRMDDVERAELAKILTNRDIEVDDSSVIVKYIEY